MAPRTLGDFEGSRGLQQRRRHGPQDQSDGRRRARCVADHRCGSADVIFTGAERVAQTLAPHLPLAPERNTHSLAPVHHLLLSAVSSSSVVRACIPVDSCRRPLAARAFAGAEMNPRVRGALVDLNSGMLLQRLARTWPTSESTAESTWTPTRDWVRAARHSAKEFNLASPLCRNARLHRR